MATSRILNPVPVPVQSIATPLKDSSISCLRAKGLTNMPGQNNCFLNSSIQVLWHLDVFRRSFRDLTGHACLAESCIFCALKELFSELQHSSAKALPPDSLRKALADSFLDQQRFQIGFMDDAAECFENMLLRIHDHVAHREPEDACAAPHCVSHQKFAMTLVEQSICQNCLATSEPMSFTQMVQYVSTSTLVHQLRISVGQTGRPEPFGRLLQKAVNMGDTRPCPVSCGSTTQMRRVLMNHPEIVSIGLVWNSEKPSLEHISEVFSSIDTTLRLSHLFTSVTDSRWADSTTHNLVGVVTYYGKHYSTFFFNTKLMEWIFLDDATVRDVGPRWEQVVDKCRKGKFQPLLLLYATPNGTPINLEHAPKSNTPFYAADKVKPHQLLRRSVTPSPEKPNIGTTRRAITPNPENSCCLNQKPPLPKPYNEYQNLCVIQNNIVNTLSKEQDHQKVSIHRTLSNGSSSGVESTVCIPDHLNVPRRRDSGNWSGDRNSASSASSTTMENPYLYLVGKVPQVPGSPTRTKGGDLLCGGGGGGAYDAGYDSYSLSSNDSANTPTLQHMMKTGHLAQIPEDYGHVPVESQSCDVLCDEADQLLVKSRQLEDAHDLVLALALCNAAATKARAAMNAPYNNPQTLTLARMKHNTCIMRARSLHRRMTQGLSSNKDNSPEIRHTREGSSGSGRHSRQNSRDKGQHSRQGSREQPIINKSIEIYATLPKKLKTNKAAAVVEDEDNKPQERQSRSIFSKNKDNKRSRSEDRQKITGGDFSVAPDIKDTLKKAKEAGNEEKKDKEGKNKKQHKIRRKLLMGGLIRRKNRSMPDLTDSNAEEAPADKTLPEPASPPAGMTGYLSEGHLEFTANPNLERSKLMRKSFHGSAGKILTAAKVPPPPPLRTTSQLSRANKPNEPSGEVTDAGEYVYDNNFPEHSSMSLPYFAAAAGNSNSSYDDDSFHRNPSSETVITHAEVHQEQNAINLDSGLDEVDCLPSHGAPMLELPPYPSPVGSVVHSRQASEEFPPPPPPLDLSALEEYLPETEPNSLLARLQSKRNQILTHHDVKLSPAATRSSGDTWLKELQAKQLALRMKKSEVMTDCTDVGVDEVNTQRFLLGEVVSVKDLASKFENSQHQKVVKSISEPITTITNKPNNTELSTPERIAEEIREVEMITSAVNKVFSCREEAEKAIIRPPPKKKSVSFCDQVTLVATAEEQEEDTYIPNPILERVLRSAVNNPETVAVRQELKSLRDQNNIPGMNQPQRRNSTENLLMNHNGAVPQPSDWYQPNHHRQNNNNYGNESPMYDTNNGYYHLPVPEPHIIYSKPPPPPSSNGYYMGQPSSIYQPYGAPQVASDNYCPPQNLNHHHNAEASAIRQSPYQLLPQNSPMHPAYYGLRNGNIIYGSAPLNQPAIVRQSITPSPLGPANSANFHPTIYRGSPNSACHLYQRVPAPQMNNYCPDPHQQQQQQYQSRGPLPHGDEPIYPQMGGKYPAYQQVPPPKHFNNNNMLKKSVSFEPGTKGCEPKPIVTPIVVNNANNSVPTDKTKCTLCRKKQVVIMNMYCKDCEFYMSRFKPKA